MTISTRLRVAALLTIALPGAAAAQQDVALVYRLMLDGQMAVQPERRANGLGRLLVQHIARTAIEHGDSDITLSPQDDVEAFYLKLGFAFTDETAMDATPSTVLER